MEHSIGLSSGKEKYRIYTARNISFPDHIHHNFEIMIVLCGRMATFIDGIEYELLPGDCAIIFPLQHHKFSVDESTSVKICLFSSDLVAEFEYGVRGKLPATPVFRGDNMPSSPASDTPLSIRSFFYVLCENAMRHLKMTDANRKPLKNSAVERMLLYVDENYDSDCDLRTVARSLKYDYTYLSRMFKKITGYTFNGYVNRFRIERACYDLIQSSLDITSVAYSVGYASMRTFNREFRKITGTTPGDYRARISLNSEQA